MPLEDLISRKRIDDAVEWKLIYRLRQNSHHISPHGCVAVDSGSTRTQELHDDILSLDMQIRRTFTNLRLDMMLHLGSKMADDVSQADSESVTDDDSSWDSWESVTYDDSSWDSSDSDSHSSVESRLSSPPTELLDSPGHIALPSAKEPLTCLSCPCSLPSANEALSHLSDLCSLLEGRVNPSLIPVEPGDSDQTRGYPRLTLLMEYLQSLTHSTTSLQFIPIPGSAPTQFLFNITEDPATAGAFVSFSDREQKRPQRKTRQRMLQEVGLLSRRFSAFNNFFDKLQIPGGYLNNLAKPPIQSSTSNESFASFALLQKFRRQTKAACDAIFSQFGLCDRRGSTKHELRLQLPGWEDVSDCHSTDEKGDLPVQLLLTMCSQEDSWKPARMYWLQYVIPLPRTSDTGARLPSVTDIPRDMSEYTQHTNVCTQGQLCGVLEGCRNKNMDLQFYASEDCKGDGHDGLPIDIPKRPERTRICGDSSPSQMYSLWTLINRGYFEKEQNLVLLLSIGGKDSILSFDQRKALAIKLILGLMLSMDSDHVFESWDPKHIYFLKPVDTQNSPFISISRKEDRSSRSTSLALPRLHHSGNFGEDEDGVKPLPQFAKLAKIPQALEQGFRDAWEAFRRTIDECSKRVTCEPKADLETLPFLRAALGCLDFHMKYQQRVKEASSSQTMEIAWKLVFDTILVQIDNNLTMEKLVKPSTDALGKE
ncbi:hypothetical protein BKA56DRAFT_607289 [Ilyonectria sp. MPI-CAGE-AT-0026]|nr:hypothetical protein BKA56DRAFT_607289 [Ilyonectria sp. MPI-CAGE-AT-0026]